MRSYSGPLNLGFRVFLLDKLCMHQVDHQLRNNLLSFFLKIVGCLNELVSNAAVYTIILWRTGNSPGEQLKLTLALQKCSTGCRPKNKFMTAIKGLSRPSGY